MKRFLSTEFAVGTFALLALLIIIYMSLEVNNRGPVGGRPNSYFAVFPSASGLVKGVPVEVAGIPNGYVDSIKLKDGKAHVSIKVNSDVPVHKDASVMVVSRGILGDRFLTLYPGSSDAGLLPSGSEIERASAQRDLAELSASMGEVADSLKVLLKSDNPEGALGEAFRNLRDMSRQLNQFVADNEDRLENIVVNMEAFSGDLSDITGQNKEKIGSLLASLHEVSDSLKKSLGEDGSVSAATERLNNSMASLERIMAKIERGEGTVGKLINDETTIDNINETVEGLNETLGLFRKVRLGVRYRGEFVMSDRELQNMAAIYLAPAPDKFILFEVVDAVSGETSITETSVESGGTIVAQTKTTQTDDGVTFTFLMGRRFWDTTVRFGLIRNKGGIGLDYHLFKDKLTLSVEGFDFSRSDGRAHLRTYGTIALYKHLLLTGGVDDMLAVGGPRNAFFGLGLQFTDQDLKALVTAVPKL